MLEITIKGVSIYDGTYPLNLNISEFNGRELHVIKQIAGIRMGEIEDALDSNDYDLIIALAAIALTRSGRISSDQTVRASRELLEAHVGSIEIADKSDEGADVVPPSKPLRGGVSESVPAAT